MKIIVCLMICFITFLSWGEPKTKLTTLFSFDGTNGSWPFSGLILGKDGFFYGTTSSGGIGLNQAPDHGNGTIYKMSSDGKLTTIFFFDGTNGAYLPAGLIQGSDGNFYGTTFRGGKNNRGTIFRISPSGGFTSLFSFDGLSGYNPNASLLQAKNGDFLGSCVRGGLYGQGTIFRISSKGDFKLIHSFGDRHASNPDGGGPLNLVQMRDGSVFGITVGDTIFKVTPDREFKTVFIFQGTNGAVPNYFIKGIDENMYGSTVFGGKNNAGVIFKITPTGDFTLLLNAKIGETEKPASLFQDGAGNIYFLANTGSKLIQMTSDLKLSTIYEGDTPLIGSIIMDENGDYYGTSGISGAYKRGAIIKLH